MREKITAVVLGYVAAEAHHVNQPNRCTVRLIVIMWFEPQKFRGLRPPSLGLRSSGIGEQSSEFS